MKLISIISSVLIALVCPVAALADDFNYDDEPTVEVGGSGSGTPWGGELPGVDVGVEEDIPVGVEKVESAGSAVAVKLNRAASSIIISAPSATAVPVYRIGAATVNMMTVSAGETVFVMPRGIYIIAGRKYKL